MTKTEHIENLEVLKEPPSENLDASEETQNAFADECIDLLCKQEKTLWLLGERGEKSNNDESLALTWQMLLQFLDFAERHFDAVEFSAIANSLHSVHEHTAEHKHKLNTRAWRIVRSLVGLESPDETVMGQSYRELGNDYIDLFQTFFDVCSQRFADDSSAKQRFDQSIGVFLEELQDKW